MQFGLIGSGKHSLEVLKPALEKYGDVTIFSDHDGAATPLRFLREGLRGFDGIIVSRNPARNLDTVLGYLSSFENKIICEKPVILSKSDFSRFKRHTIVCVEGLYYRLAPGTDRVGNFIRENRDLRIIDVEFLFPSEARLFSKQNFVVDYVLDYLVDFCWILGLADFDISLETVNPYFIKGILVGSSGWQLNFALGIDGHYSNRIGLKTSSGCSLEVINFFYNKACEQVITSPAGVERVDSNALDNFLKGYFCNFWCETSAIAFEDLGCFSRFGYVANFKEDFLNEIRNSQF